MFTMLTVICLKITLDLTYLTQAGQLHLVFTLLMQMQVGTLSRRFLEWLLQQSGKFGFPIEIFI